jgi:hypothetical protein
MIQTPTMTPVMGDHRYIYPPRATTALPYGENGEGLAVLAGRGWLAQLKYNDTHVVLDYDGPNFIKAWDRHAKVPVYDFENLRADLDQLGQKLVPWGGGTGRYLLDGGLLHSKHAAIKHVLVIWDILVQNGVHLLGTTYAERHHDLGYLCTMNRYVFKGHDLGALITPRIFRPDNFCPGPRGEINEWQRAWAIVQSINEDYDTPLLEGLLIKNPRGVLKHGFTERNNGEWLTRCRVKTGRHAF